MSPVPCRLCPVVEPSACREEASPLFIPCGSSTASGLLRPYLKCGDHTALSPTPNDFCSPRPLYAARMLTEPVYYTRKLFEDNSLQTICILRYLTPGTPIAPLTLVSVRSILQPVYPIALLLLPMTPLGFYTYSLYFEIPVQFLMRDNTGAQFMGEGRVEYRATLDTGISEADINAYMFQLFATITASPNMVFTTTCFTIAISGNLSLYLKQPSLTGSLPPMECLNDNPQPMSLLLSGSTACPISIKKTRPSSLSLGSSQTNSHKNPRR